MLSKRQVSVGEAAHGPPPGKGNEPRHDVLQPAAVAPITYTQHPLSAIFPAMSSEEFAALCADIQGNGLLVDIDVIGTEVIDGWHRHRACVVTGVAPRYSALGTVPDLVSFVKAKNFSRRHLSAGQMALVAADLVHFAHGGARRKAVGSTAEASENKGEFQSLKSDLESAATVEGDEARSGKAAVSASLANVAQALGISRATAALGKRVVDKGSADLVTAVRSGAISLSDGAKLSKQPLAEQSSLLQQRLNEGRQPLPEELELARAAKRIIADFKHGRAPSSAFSEKQTSASRRPRWSARH